MFDDSPKHIAIVKELLESLKFSSGGQISSILEEPEESGFIATTPEYLKKSKDKKIWLIDEYSYFYIAWMETMKGDILLGNDKNYWLKMQNDPRWKAWSGYAFESICFKHIAQIKKP